MGLLRFLLALSVVVVHAGGGQKLFGKIDFVGGNAAVQSFYVISGFYMALVLNEKYPKGAAGYRTFVTSRFIRLYPAIWFVLLATVGLAIVGVIKHPALHRWELYAAGLSLPAKALFAVSQFTLVGQDAVWFLGYVPETLDVYFARTFQGTPHPAMEFLFVPQAWTLGVEMLFYLLAPFIVRSLPRIGVMFVLSWGLRLTLVKLGFRDDPWNYRFFPNELGIFLMGSAGYHAYAYFRRAKIDTTGIAQVALGVVLLLSVFLMKLPIPARGLLMVVATAAAVPFIFQLTKRNAIDRWIGELSYPIYITHVTVKLVMQTHNWFINPTIPLEPETGFGSPYPTALIAFTLLASIAVMFCIETPVEHFRQRLVTRRTASPTP
ncbi:MAG: acyltransferase [Tepidisphaeraceae bacterium]